MISESIATQITLRHHTCPHTHSTHSQPVCRAPAFQGLSAQDLWRAEYLCNSVYLTSLTLDHTVVLYREVKSDAQDHLMLASSCPAW